MLVGAGGGDQHAAALGLGMVPGDVVYSFGTSGVVMAVSEHAVHDELGWVDGVADMTNGYLPLASTLNAAKVTDAFARLLGLDHAEMSQLALTAPVERVGPVLAAYLDGNAPPTGRAPPACSAASRPPPRERNLPAPPTRAWSSASTPGSRPCSGSGCRSAAG